jgi:uncharacterized protein (TIGR00369 family)
MTKEHYQKLENMYLAAPINKFYNPTITVEECTSEITITVKKAFFHAANAVHGSVYFKMLDDVAFFAVNSIVEDFFVLTGTFETKLLRPITEGKIVAKGLITSNWGNKFEAESELFNSKGKLVATGKGTFIKSKILLASIDSFKV